MKIMETHAKPQSVGGKVAGKIRRNFALKKYYKDPKFCLYCKKIIEVKENEKVANVRRKKFCCVKCSSSFNKEKRIEGLIKSNKKRRKPIFDIQCLNCLEIFRGKENRKFCSTRCDSEYKYNEIIRQWKEGTIKGYTGKLIQLRKPIRKYIIIKYGGKCLECGWSKKNKYTNKIPLHVNHKDGNPKNCKEENLEPLCPNCHSLTSNFGSLNKGSPRDFANAYKQRGGAVGSS